MSVWGKSLLHPSLKGLAVPINHRESSVWIRCLQDANQSSSSSRILLWSHKGVTVATVVTGLSLWAGWKAWKIASLGERRGPAVCVWGCVWALMHFSLLHPPLSVLGLRSPATAQSLQGWRLHYSAWQAALRPDHNLCLIEFWHFSFTLALTVYLTGLKH